MEDRHRLIETSEDLPCATFRPIASVADRAGHRPGRRRTALAKGDDAIVTLDAPLPADAEPGSRDHGRLDARDAHGRRNGDSRSMPRACSSGSPRRRATPSKPWGGRTPRATTSQRSPCPLERTWARSRSASGASHAPGGTCATSFELFRVRGHDRSAGSAAAAAPARPWPARAPAPVSGARRRSTRRRGARQPIPREPDHADSFRPGAVDGSLRRRRLAGRAGVIGLRSAWCSSRLRSWSVARPDGPPVRRPVPRRTPTGRRPERGSVEPRLLGDLEHAVDEQVFPEQAP